MFKTLTIALVTAALISGQTFADATDLILESGSTWKVSEIISQMKSEEHNGKRVNVEDKVTIIADMLDPDLADNGASYDMVIEKAVTLHFDDFYGRVDAETGKLDPDSELFLLRGLTFNADAQLTVEFSEGMVDYIMTKYPYYGGSITAQALIFTGLTDLPTDLAMTLGTATVNLLQSKGISANQSGRFSDLTAEGQGGLCTMGNYLYFFAGTPAATPEPATATLSLLALAALASRRKRH